MQPAIKMALRAARQNSDFLKDQQARLEPANQTADVLVRSVQGIEKTIHERSVESLQRAYRDHWIAPAGSIESNGYVQTWHIFPLLGEQNFARGLPEFATAILQKINDRPENLVVLCPLTGEEYAFSRGYGAVLNSRRIRVRNSDHLDQTLLSCNLFTQAQQDADSNLWLDLTGTLVREGAGLRHTGCAVLDMARVAGGFLDGVALATEERHEHVMATLISQESGALSGDLRGNPLSRKSRELLIANSPIFREILKQFQPYRQRLTPSA